MLICGLALIAQFYVALYPVGGPNLDTATFFQLYLAGPLLIFLYFVWKVYSWFVRPVDRPLWIPISKIDLYAGMRDSQTTISGENVDPEARRASIEHMQAMKPKTVKDHAMGVVRSVF